MCLSLAHVGHIGVADRPGSHCHRHERMNIPAGESCSENVGARRENKSVPFIRRYHFLSGDTVWERRGGAVGYREPPDSPLERADGSSLEQGSPAQW